MSKDNPFFNFFSKSIEAGMHIQQKQYDLFTKIIQNQFELVQTVLKAAGAANDSLYQDKAAEKK